MAAVCQVCVRKLSVTYDATGTGVDLSNQTAASLTGSWSQTATAGADVFAAVDVTQNSGLGFSSITATYGGATMTQVGLVKVANSNYGSLAVFHAAGVAGGPKTVSVTATAASGGVTALVGNSVSYLNVASLGTVTTSNAQNYTLSVTATGSSQGMVFNAFGGQYGNSAVSFGAYSQTQRYLYSNTTATDGVLLIGDSATVGSITFTAAASGTSPGPAWGGIAIPLIPSIASVATGNVIKNTNVASGTPIPSGTIGCYVTLIGAGASGGAGPRSASAGTGGIGGGGGALVVRSFIPVASLGSTYSVTFGSTPGAASIFTSGSIILTAGGGSGATGGTATASGISGIPLVNGSNGGAAATAGASNTGGAGSGGGGGSGVNANGVFNSAFGAGGSTTGGGAGGAGEGLAGSASATDGFGGGGGSGGGSAAGGASSSQPGGAGGAPGGGGGGGSATGPAYEGSAGGTGATGLTKIEWA